MKPALEHLPLENNQSFVVKKFDYPFFPTPWHFHPEFEIVLVTEGTGKRLIGDHISENGPGNLAFIGPNIPHTYRSHEHYRVPDSSLRSRSIVVHFTPASLGAGFLDLPEASAIRQLMNASPVALDFPPGACERLTALLHELTELDSLDRWLKLVEILQECCSNPSMNQITGSGQTGGNQRETERMCAVLEWITNNFEREVRLETAAAIAGMHQQAFSRFFSKRTRKTFQGFVQELRLQKASRLLREQQMSVTEICYECGYNNLSNFNRQFLRQYRLNPVSYRRNFRMD